MLIGRSIHPSGPSNDRGTCTTNLFGWAERVHPEEIGVISPTSWIPAMTVEVWRVRRITIGP